jgi:hypothetical protein
MRVGRLEIELLDPSERRIILQETVGRYSSIITAEKASQLKTKDPYAKIDTILRGTPRTDAIWLMLEWGVCFSYVLGQEERHPVSEIERNAQSAFLFIANKEMINNMQRFFRESGRRGQLYFQTGIMVQKDILGLISKGIMPGEVIEELSKRIKGVL